MSKKYILEVKEKYSGFVSFIKPINGDNLVSSNMNKYRKINDEGIISREPSLLTQEEINELPYGFVKMFNIVEVEETKYYWRKKQEHLCSFEVLNHCYLNVWIIDNEPTLSSTKEVQYYKTKFTESEAKELLGDDFDMFERVDIE